MTRSTLSGSALFAGLVAFAMPLGAAPASVQVESANIRVEFDSLLHSRIVARFDGKETPLGDFVPSEFVTSGNSPWR